LPKHTAVLGPKENALQSIETSRTFYPLTRGHFPIDFNVSKHLKTSNLSKIHIISIRQHTFNKLVQSSAGIKETSS